MEPPRRFLVPALLLLLSALLWPDSEVGSVRLQPLEQALRLSGATGEIPLELFASSALIFSGYSPEAEPDKAVSPPAEVQLFAGQAQLFAGQAQLFAGQARLQEWIARLRELLTPSGGAVIGRKEAAERILQLMHEEILTAYREKQTRLDVLLEEGSYNCVSSAVLYSILAKSAGFTVWAVRTADHAFSRIRVGEEVFDVETTSPFGFNPGAKKEFKDHFGRVTGFSYVPPTSGGQRRELGDRELLALILYNRSAFHAESREYGRAVEPALDAYFLLRDKESYERLIVSFMNLASWEGMQQRYAQAVEFLQRVRAEHQEPRLAKLQEDILHNWVLSLDERGALDEALALLEARLRSGQFSVQEWKSLTLYTYQLKAENVSRRDFAAATALMREAMDKVGREPELLRGYEVYAHNQAVKLTAAGRQEEAEGFLLQALQVLPGSPLLLKDRKILQSQVKQP